MIGTLFQTRAVPELAVFSPDVRDFVQAKLARRMAACEGDGVATRLARDDSHRARPAADAADADLRAALANRKVRLGVG